jgi:hypothetical protein
MNIFLKKIGSYVYFSKKMNLILFWASVVTLLVSIFRLLNQRIQVYFLNTSPIGDEPIFVDSFRFLIKHGWYGSVAKGTSPLFNLFVCPFYLLSQNPLLSFKILNISCLIVILIIWIWFLVQQLATNKKITIISILFLIQLGLTQNTFFMGVNDALFAVFVSLGFIFIYKGIIHKNSKKIIGSAFLFAAALSVRELLFIYLPGIGLIFIICFLLNLINARLIFLWILTFVFTTGIVHLPSLIENKSLSTLDKNPKMIHATWSERNYLQVLEHRKTQPSWEEVLAYKKEHGENALPTKIPNAILMNPLLTAKNFIRQLYLSQMPFIRQLGLFYILIPIYLLALFRKKAKFTSNFLWIPAMFYGCFTFFLCIQIIPTLQFRWFVIFPFLITVFSISEISKRMEKNNWMESVLCLNVLIIAIANALLIGIW